MNLGTREEMRRLDKLALDKLGLTGLVLMENAGRAVADGVKDTIGPVAGRRIFVLAGKGNNGGDGLVAARHLENEGANVRVFLFGVPDELSTDAKVNYGILTAVGSDVVSVREERDWRRVQLALPFADCLIDALVGTGAQGALTGAIERAAELLNAAHRPVVSVDIPSGIDADTGAAFGTAAQATRTVTLAMPKPGLFLYPGAGFTGALAVADIGIPNQLTAELALRRHVVEIAWVREVLPKRRATDHKGDAGRVLVAAGSRGFTGAAVLSATAAARSGAGLVTAAVPRALELLVAGKLTEVMTLGLPDQGEGAGLVEAAADILLERAKQAQVLAIGPGLGREAGTQAVVRQVLQQAQCPLVLDADALFALVEEPALLGKAAMAPVITPHPGEMGRLLGMSAEEVNQNRLAVAQKAAAEWGAIIVLKGAPTIIAYPDGDVCVNPTGGPVLATGGSGDVLTGVIAAFIAQGMTSHEAAVAGVYVHGLAGQLLERSGELGVLAGDVAAALPAAIAGIIGRDGE